MWRGGGGAGGTRLLSNTCHFSLKVSNFPNQPIYPLRSRQVCIDVSKVRVEGGLSMGTLKEGSLTGRGRKSNVSIAKREIQQCK
jgi:hypothetical protein